MKILAVTLQVHWGFSIRTPYGSRLQSSYQLPPPTTLVGALARACGGAGEVDQVGGYYVSYAYRFARDYGIKWASAGWLTHYTSYTSLIRYFSGPYQSEKTLADIALTRSVAELFAPVNLGYVVSPGGKIIAVYAGEGVEKLKNCAWYVDRLGSKESIVSVEDVSVGELRPCGGRAWTSVYVPKDGINAIGAYREAAIHIWRRNGRPSWLCSYMLNYVDGCEQHEEVFIMPMPTEEVEISPGADWLCGEVAAGGVRYRVAIPGQRWHYE